MVKIPYFLLNNLSLPQEISEDTEIWASNKVKILLNICNKNKYSFSKCFK